MAYSKGDLVASMATQTGATKKMAADMLDALLDAITGELMKGGSVTLTGFGTFRISNRAARMGVNPATGERIKIKASKAAVFKAGKKLKEAVN